VHAKNTKGQNKNYFFSDLKKVYIPIKQNGTEYLVPGIIVKQFVENDKNDMRIIKMPIADID
jgi:hypothetical protein